MRALPAGWIADEMRTSVHEEHPDSRSDDRVRKRESRLRSNEDFQRVRREGRSWAHPLLVLRARRNGLESSRIGFSVSRAVGKAVVRNRVRRVLREIVRLYHDRLALGWDVVLIARPAIVESSFHDLATVVEGLLGQAGLLVNQKHEES